MDRGKERPPSKTTCSSLRSKCASRGWRRRKKDVKHLWWTEEGKAAACSLCYRDTHSKETAQPESSFSLGQLECQAGRLGRNLASLQLGS